MLCYLIWGLDSEIESNNLEVYLFFIRKKLKAIDSKVNIKSLISNEDTDKNQIDQNVQIEATFPNVNSKREIEEALNDLVNLAAQRAMRR